jgi:hypothetical protein
LPPDIGLTGGEKLLNYLRDINRRLAPAAGSPEVRVGFLEGATYPDGTPVPEVAAYNEFGTSKSLPRPFFRRMIKAKAPTWGDDMGKLLTQTQFSATTTLGLMGERIKGQLQQSIVDLVSPPLAQATVARKGSAKPLVDTGHMLNSVDYEVET